MKSKLFATFAVIAGGLILTGCGVDIDRAEENLGAYSAKFGLTPIGCVGQDSDQNGYVSCDAKNEATGEPVRLECAYRRVGCKAKGAF